MQSDTYFTISVLSEIMSLESCTFKAVLMICVDVHKQWSFNCICLVFHILLKIKCFACEHLI